ncbi:GGDEF domain-containing protein [Thiobacillus sedimenti]|uniref:diguanylate cyclase n=1 Tax=Thiobacillus sedimenti TaxID=3110231 RepID=A0ABZ1CPM7_9PROT|nr:diguanylate cyclase [Thiobacillus sp. SCUT-2]WRS40272.1 diguanylate cyclase [Thiobacillus sp. SCUT-2]
MAEPSDKINPGNPTEVARETLRRLALRRIAPTPDNYQTLYEEIVGGPVAGTPEANPSSGAAGVLAGLTRDLSLHHPDLAGPVELLNQAVRKSDWAQCRKQLGQVVLQLKQGDGGELRPQADNLTLLRELLVKTLEFGVVAQLSHIPRLAERGQQLAVAVRDANSSTTLRDAASGLKSLWVDIELQSSEARDQQDTLKRILLLLVENIGEMLDDDAWLRGQLDMVQEVMAGPLKIRSLQEAEKRLKEVIYKQSLVKHGLREATATLKATMTTFVSRMRDAVAANDEYQGRIATHIDRISRTEDVIELNRILEALLEETRAAQADSRRAHENLVQERDTALQAEARIKDLEDQLARMSALIREDPLTGSLNRRGLDDEFVREAARADRYDTPFSIAVLDVDNFKALNDKRGHQAGDDALVHLVKVAQEELRITDHIARLGGEEFLVILPNTGRDEAARIITRLQRSLTKKYFLDNNERVLITFSAGVAERAPGEAQEALITRADGAMYEAKRSGKNRVCLAPDAPADAAD